MRKRRETEKNQVKFMKAGKRDIEKEI